MRALPVIGIAAAAILTGVNGVSDRPFGVQEHGGIQARASGVGNFEVREVDVDLTLERTFELDEGHRYEVEASVTKGGAR